MGTYENLRLEVDGAVAVLTLDRPKALNALNSRLLAELQGAISEVAQNAQIRALIVTGGGEKAFVAGADIAEMAEMSADQALQFSARGQAVFEMLETLSIPTIAAVNGFALGGGCELALACDFIYASEKAKFGLPEVGLGVIPGFGGTSRLSRVVGRARAKEMICSGENIDAAKAKDIGLALEVFAPEQLLPASKEIAGKIAKKGPLAVSQAKRAVNLGSDVSLSSAAAHERQSFALLFASGDQREGMRAFLEKRAPQFQGK